MKDRNNVHKAEAHGDFSKIVAYSLHAIHIQYNDMISDTLSNFKADPDFFVWAFVDVF